MNFAFLGTDSFSVTVLEELKKAGLLPKLVIAVPDRPSGRGHQISKPESKIWAEQNNISVIQPPKLNADFINELINFPKENGFDEWDIFIVASYGKIIPNEILEMPRKKTLNIHPSLLPLYRGASPIESAMLDDAKETGVTIILVDEEMDHGPILNQEVVMFNEWDSRPIVEERLAKVGGSLIANSLPLWMNDEIEPQEQNHDGATYTKKISKEDGEISVSDILSEDLDSATAREIFLKIQTFQPWPNVFFFIKHKDKNIRVKITKAAWNGRLEVLRVIPEGRKEMDFESFKKGFLN